MTAENFLVALGLGDLLARDYLAVQLLVFAATVLLFAMSLAVTVMSSRSAGGARKARAEAEALLRNAQDVMVEARQLSARIERSAALPRPAGSAGAPIRVSAAETTREAEVEIIDLKHGDVASNRDLAAARESATVPKGLLRRRR